MNALEDPNKKCTVLKMILRTIGCLSIPKQHFSRSSKHGKEFAHRIMMDMQRDSKMLYQSVNENEQSLFKYGLITLLCIELVYEKRRKINENEIALLQEMFDKNQCEDIAYQLLCQLHRLNFPIVGDSNWTELFTMIDPAKIEIKYLDLVDSLEAFIQCMKHISKVLLEDNRFQRSIKDYFDQRISKKHIRGRL